MWNKKADKDKKRILVGASGASGMPLLIKCLELIKEEEDYESWLIMTDSAVLTFKQEARMSVEEVKKLADHNLDSEEIGAKPASGSFKTCGMLVVPCSMKTAAGSQRLYRQPSSKGCRCDHKGAKTAGACSKGDAYEFYSSEKSL